MKPVYTLDDLKNWQSATADLPAKPILAVIGDPVAHSKSPQMHQPALDHCEIEGTYVRIHLTPDEVFEGLELMKDNGFVGTNVTIPHKSVALSFATAPDPLAIRMGAANTLVFGENETTAFNSDGPGFLRAIRECFRIDLSDLRVLIIGVGGGAGRAVAVQCAVEGCERLVLANRTLSKAEALAKELAPEFDTEQLAGPDDALSAIGTTPEEFEHELPRIDLIVNATPIGMKSTDPEVLPGHLIEPHHLIYDMVYSGGAETRLITAAKRNNAPSSDGLPMLLHQGAISFEYWFNRPAPLAQMRKGLLS